MTHQLHMTDALRASTLELHCRLCAAEGLVGHVPEPLLKHPLVVGLRCAMLTMRDTLSLLPALEFTPEELELGMAEANTTFADALREELQAEGWTS